MAKDTCSKCGGTRSTGEGYMGLFIHKESCPNLTSDRILYGKSVYEREGDIEYEDWDDAPDLGAEEEEFEHSMTVWGPDGPESTHLTWQMVVGFFIGIVLLAFTIWYFDLPGPEAQWKQKHDAANAARRDANGSRVR